MDDQASARNGWTAAQIAKPAASSFQSGLANTAPLLPGNVGVYQGAALGALAIAGYSGSHAVAASLMTPFVVTLATATAALVGLALYGNRVPQLSRAALRPSKA